VPSNFGPKTHNAVSPNVTSAIQAFFGLSDWNGLWLTGGTCLAEYYFGHRVSVDIDLFSSDSTMVQAARTSIQDGAVFRHIGSVETVRVSPAFSQFLLRCSDGETVKIDLVKDIPVHLGDKVKFGDIWLDSLNDLASNKMGCLVHREEVKDYVDLYYLLPFLRLGASEALELGLKKEAGLDPVVLAAQMQFVQSQPEPEFMIGNARWADIQTYFRKFREEILRLAGPGS
jgi:hypothetical protein